MSAENDSIESNLHELAKQFEDFLRSFKNDEGVYVYRDRLAELMGAHKKSIVIDYDDLIRYNTDLATALLLYPDETLENFRSFALEVLSSENAEYAAQIRQDFMVRINRIADRVPLRNIDVTHLDKMVAFTGMVMRMSGLAPLLTDAAFVCPEGHTTRVIQDGPNVKKPTKCESCDEQRNFELDERDSTFINSQFLRVQELPEELPPGQMPSFFDVDVTGDLVNMARPGDRVVITGIIRAEQDTVIGQQRSRTFKTKIESNYIEVLAKDPTQTQLTAEDEEKIKQFAAQPDAYQSLLKSMAPAVLGHDLVKEAILLLLVGGQPTLLPDGARLRGDIHVLIVGDPGIAKSEMLKFAARAAPRGIFASGKGSTAAGLTAAVIREKNIFMLEAGVVVLADGGLAVIDEFAQLKDEDRSSLHEQMEQQVVSISKAGIHATLNARTSILAAANPVLGRYNPYQSLIDNINVPSPLLSRFDLIFVLRDLGTPDSDSALASHILDVHAKQGYTEEPPLTFAFLKKYIAYAKGTQAKLTNEAKEKLKKYYLTMRQQSNDDEIKATPRALESLIRLATARARLLLRTTITGDDADVAINLMSKMVQDVLTDKDTGKQDFGNLEGHPQAERGKLTTIQAVFKILEEGVGKPVEARQFRAELLKTGKYADEAEVEKLLQKALKEGMFMENPSGYYKRLSY